MPFSARAAEFSKTASTNGGPDIIFAVGELTLGDENKFINVALSTGSAIVVFESPGGNLIAGIEIGKAIHLKGFATFVPDTVQCASACALAWLGGRVRLMSNTARVGFHAVYVGDSGQAAVSSAGNALVGAYLNQLGLPASAIIYITQASPQGMQWLTFADAQSNGIDVRAYDLSAPNAAPPQRSEQNGSSSQVSSARKEIYELFNATNRSNGASLNYLQNKYTDQVNYYGKLLPKASVLADKKRFFNRWPIRNYSIQPTSVAVTCESTSECKTEGVLDWNASSNGLSSVGSATFSLLWTLDGGAWKIHYENGRTIGRKVTKLAPRETTSSAPAYQLDSSQTKVISISNLYPSQDCASGGVVVGKIVQREFGKDGLKITGVVVEQSDGTRAFINVDVDPAKWDMATTSWIMSGLQTLLAEGRSVQLDVRMCGAAGRVQFIDTVREQPSRSGG